MTPGGLVSLCFYSRQVALRPSASDSINRQNTGFLGPLELLPTMSASLLCVSHKPARRNSNLPSHAFPG